MARIARTLLPLLAAVVGSACQPLDFGPISDVLRSSAQLALAGAAAMTSITGEAPPCVSMTPSCQEAPCAARVEVTIDEACPLALGEGSGTVILDGQWSDEDTGTFTPDLSSVDLNLDDEDVALALGAIVLTRRDGKVGVSFGGQAVDVDGGEEPAAGVDQEAYTVEVDLSGTPADPRDDVLEISGGGQRVVGADVVQVAVALTKTDPSCRRNPVSGTATLSDTGAEDASNTTLSFHEACDGQATVLTSTDDPTQIGSDVPLAL